MGRATTVTPERPQGVSGAGEASLTPIASAPMPSPVPLDHRLETPRLTLRRFSVADAERVNEITSNWNVARMLRLAPYPQSVEEKRAWLVSHEAEWIAGEAYRFAVIDNGTLIGCADVDEIATGRNEIGYWLDERCWGRGLATEAATAVRDFALRTLGLDRLTSGHASDNPDSGRVLEKIGFRWTEDVTVWSLPRQAEIVQRRYAMRRPACASTRAGSATHATKARERYVPMERQVGVKRYSPMSWADPPAF